MTRRTLLTSAAVVVTSAATEKAELISDHNGAQVSRTAGGVLMLSWNFTLGSHGWLPGFSDYHLNQSHLDLVAEVRPMPAEAGAPAGHRGYFLQGMNRSDDLFMYLRKQLDARQGIEASRNYWAHMHIAFASDAGSGCVGAGGAPGEGVYLKAGVFANEPATDLVNNNVQLLVDKGQQSVGGQDMHLLGNIANGRPCQLPTAGYVMLQRVLYQPQVVRSSAEATLWSAVGFDSAFEGLTQVYIYTIGINLIPA